MLTLYRQQRIWVKNIINYENYEYKFARMEALNQQLLLQIRQDINETQRYLKTLPNHIRELVSARANVKRSFDTLQRTLRQKSSGNILESYKRYFDALKILESLAPERSPLIQKLVAVATEGIKEYQTQKYPRSSELHGLEITDPRLKGKGVLGQYDHSASFNVV